MWLRNFVSAFLFAFCASTAHADDVVVLDRERVIALAEEQSPAVLVARARVEEARAHRVGADIRAQSNPELSVAAGPRFFGDRTVTPDVFVGLAWPIDFSRASSARMALADTRVAEAEAALAEVQRRAVADALSTWITALAANERAQLEVERARLDDELLALATTRRAAGATGDGDVAMATVVRAQGISRRHVVVGELRSSLESLHGKLGIPAENRLEIAGAFDAVPSLQLRSLLDSLARRADILQAHAAVASAESDSRLQDRLGAPVPRVVVGGAHDPEYSAHVGFDIPLPVYQRNQTNAAVAVARISTFRAALAETTALANAEVRAAYASYVAAQESLAALEDSRGAIDDAEHLALRAYELGQTPLSSVLVVRREAMAARAAWLDARSALAHARAVLNFVTGVW